VVKMSSGYTPLARQTSWIIVVSEKILAKSYGASGMMREEAKKCRYINYIKSVSFEACRKVTRVMLSQPD
jgi:hypothetical protein